MTVLSDLDCMFFIVDWFKKDLMLSGYWLEEPEPVDEADSELLMSTSYISPSISYYTLKTIFSVL